MKMSRDGALTGQAAQLIGILSDAEVYGLRSEDYANDRLRGRIDSWPEFDRALSAAATRLLMDLHFGRVAPRAAGFDLPRPRADLNVEGAARHGRRRDSPRGSFLAHPRAGRIPEQRSPPRRTRSISSTTSIATTPGWRGFLKAAQLRP
jgi:hypothetical protein